MFKNLENIENISKPLTFMHRIISFLGVLFSTKLRTGLLTLDQTRKKTYIQKKKSDTFYITKWCLWHFAVGQAKAINLQIWRYFYTYSVKKREKYWIIFNRNAMGLVHYSMNYYLSKCVRHFLDSLYYLMIFHTSHQMLKYLLPKYAITHFF